MKDEDELILDIVEKLARDGATGAKKRQVDTVKNWFASSDQGRVEDLIRELIRNPSAPSKATVARAITSASQAFRTRKTG